MPKFIPNPRSSYDKYPRDLEVGCLNRTHAEIVHFTIPRGKKTGKCPKCGRKVTR